MDKGHVQEAKELYDRGMTFYAIRYQLKQWFNVTYSDIDIHTAVKGDNHPVGHAKFRS